MIDRLIRLTTALAVVAVAVGYLRELDPKLGTTVQINRVLAAIRRRFPDEHGEYCNYLWGRVQPRPQAGGRAVLSVLVQPKALKHPVPRIGAARPASLARP